MNNELYLLYVMGQNDFKDAYLVGVYTEDALFETMQKKALDEKEEYEEDGDDYTDRMNTFFMVMKTTVNTDEQSEQIYYKMVYNAHTNTHTRTVDTQTFKHYKQDVLTLF